MSENAVQWAPSVAATASIAVHISDNGLQKKEIEREREHCNQGGTGRHPFNYMDIHTYQQTTTDKDNGKLKQQNNIPVWRSQFSKLLHNLVTMDA